MQGRDFSEFYSEFALFLDRAAHKRLGRRSDDVDEAVQQTLLFVHGHQQEIPSSAPEVRRWLVSILDLRVRQIVGARSPRLAAKTCGLPRIKLAHVKRSKYGETVGTESGSLAESVEEISGEDSAFARTVDDLTLRQRKLIFDPASSMNEVLEQAAARDKLRREMGGQVAGLSPETRILDFIRQHCDRRLHATPAHYLSTFRTIERQRGKPVRIADLDAAFFERYAANGSVSNSTRKRIVAVWNAAAQLALIDPPPSHRPRVELPHPMYWTTEQIAKADEITSTGTVWGVPKQLYWPAVIRVAARTALPFRKLLKLTWSEFKSNALLWARLDLPTVELLVKLEAHGFALVFPRNCNANVFHHRYETVIRKTGLVSGSLTRAERDILNDAVNGMTESKTAVQRNCHVHTVCQYRRRIREKLSLSGQASMREVAEAAKRLNLLDSSVSTDAANPRSYTSKPR